MTNNKKTYNEESIQNQKGKYIFYCIIGIFIIREATIIIIGKPDIVQIVLFLFLVIFSFQGHKWARILLSVLYVLEGTSGFDYLLFFISFQDAAQYATYSIGNIAFELLSLVTLTSSSLFLIFSNDVIAYLERNKAYVKQSSSAYWTEAEGVITLSSIPIAFIVLGIVIEFLNSMLAPAPEGIYYATPSLIIHASTYLAIPCGLLNIIVGNLARTGSLAKKKVAATGFVVGIVGILIGLLMWFINITISSFEF